MLRIPVPVPSRPTVLLVEDAADMRLLLRFHLEREGLEVLAVADGAEALDIIAERPACDLAIVDYWLPQADGLEVVRELRRSPEWEAVPVLMLTANSEEQLVLRAFREGVSDYASKPFRPAELLARVQRLLRDAERLGGKRLLDLQRGLAAV